MKKIWNNPKLIAVLIFLLAFAVRLAYTYLRGRYNFYDGDEGFHGQIAGNLAQGLGYTFEGRFYTSRTPLLALLTGVYSWLFGYSVLKVHLFGAFLGATVPLCTYLLAWQWTKNRVVATTAALYLVFYPFLVHISSFLDSENIFTPLLLLYAYCLGVYKDKVSKFWLIASGILLGLALLARPMIFMFPILFVLLQQKWWADWRKWFVFLFIQYFLALLVILPWSVTLSRAVGHPAFITVGTNSAMLGGTNVVVIRDKQAAGEWVNIYRDFPEAAKEMAALTGKEVPAETEMVKAFIKKYPVETGLLMVHKFLKLWGFAPKHYTNNTPADTWLGFLSYGWLLPFLLLALIDKETVGRDILLGLGASITIMALITSGTMRFRVPLDPMIVIIVAGYIYKVLESRLINEK